MTARARRPESSPRSSTPPTIGLTLSEETLDVLADLVADRLAALMPTGNGSDWMTSAEAAEYLRLPSTDSIHRLTAAGAVPHRKVHGRCLFSKAELDAWLRDYYAGPSRYSPIDG
jgi:excisionase family DNA binding protein